MDQYLLKPDAVYGALKALVPRGGWREIEGMAGRWRMGLVGFNRGDYTESDAFTGDCCSDPLP